MGGGATEVFGAIRVGGGTNDSTSEARNKKPLCKDAQAIEFQTATVIRQRYAEASMGDRDRKAICCYCYIQTKVKDTFRKTCFNHLKTKFKE